MLLVLGVMPSWQWLSSRPQAMGVLAGINASVVGVLAGAWIDPIVLTSIGSLTDVMIAITCTVLLIWKKVPVWTIVMLGPAMSLIFNWVALSG
jgi:chromate transporter